METVQMERPGMFGTAADTRRHEFDSKNEELLYMRKKILLDFIGDSITHAFELGAYFRSENGILINRGFEEILHFMYIRDFQPMFFS